MSIGALGGDQQNIEDQQISKITGPLDQHIFWFIFLFIP
jgi:hypothetical protein